MPFFRSYRTWNLGKSRWYCGACSSNREDDQRLLWAAHGWMYPCASVSQRVFVWNLSYKNEFDYHEMNL